MDKQYSKTQQSDRENPVDTASLMDPVVLGHIFMDVFQKAQPLWQDFLEKHEFSPEDFVLKDPLNLQPVWFDFMNQLFANPQKLMEQQMQFWQDWFALWQDTAKKFIEGGDSDLYRPEKSDRRFKSPLWEQSALFDFIKQSYLLSSSWVRKVVHETEGLDQDTRQKLEFYTKQFLDALAPTNFVLTNPEVLRETIETRGENLLRGFENLLEDLERGKGELNISTTQYEAFRLGENVATTPGKVVYQNDLMQLIQYKAATDKVLKRPLLIVPPWINKYYILDLRPENSFIKWLTGQGHTVFIISWVNPDRELSGKRFEDYMEEGIIEALGQIEKVTGEPDCNAIGYCLGGTLLAVTLAWLAARKESGRIASATFLTTLVDFEKAGNMKIFMDEAQLQLLDKEMAEKGFLPASYLKKTFSLLRANDMIWTFVVNNYLLGREPFPFDLLYWNDDSTNMPAAMHSFYMRKCYHENLLPVPGGVTVRSVPIDMGKVKTPSYILSTRDDHIAPWEATYETAHLFKGPVTFVLAASGHVAGVINSPQQDKYCHWTSPEIKRDPQEWLEHAHEHKGSWWPHWHKWVTKHQKETVPARKIGGGRLKPIEDAPGSYVKTKAA